MKTLPEKRHWSECLVRNGAASGVYVTYHGKAAVQRVVHIRNDAAGVCQGARSTETAEEAGDGKRLDVRRQRLPDDEGHVGKEGEDEDGPTAKEFRKRRPHNGPARQESVSATAADRSAQEPRTRSSSQGGSTS